MSEGKEEPKPKTEYIDGQNIPNVWLVRPCESYKDEYTECASIKGRFHQYFIFGENSDCTQWQTDFENCMKYRLHNDIPALEAVIQSESKRRYERLAPHYYNDVWKHRTNPPEDWNKPLPAKMQEEYKNTYLDHKAREYKASQT
ncbi:UPF0545 protein C22orf39 homolog [Daphnia carinata]|uniref:UPF0545 protein C22orf39 homolog n=1 Tax=Daphnia carinata TaxID=120202 RepID=UPI002580C8A8|nr:UPF0545 protein C22orf39 homolog [Daphnia carinata]